MLKQGNMKLIGFAFLNIVGLLFSMALTGTEILGQGANSGVKTATKFSSSYTDTTKQCKGAEPTFTCKGYGDYRIVMDIGGAFANARVESTKSDFVVNIAERQSVGWNPKVEWRTANGKPFAVIVRADANDENADVPQKIGEILLVKGLAGYERINESLDATSAKANEKAREIADQSFAGGTIEKSGAAQTSAVSLPQMANSVEKFVPAGWMIEQTVSGDLNNDSVPDAAVKLIEKMPAGADQYNPPPRERVLVILLKNADGAFERAAVTDSLLQCTTCGGAFYGLADAPADLEISKGVLILKQEFGSRDATQMTFCFRFDPKVKRFALIGYDKIGTDRNTGDRTSRSTNYLTGVAITESFQYNKKTDKYVKTSTDKSKIITKFKYLEDIDYENFEETSN